MRTILLALLGIVLVTSCEEEITTNDQFFTKENNTKDQVENRIKELDSLLKTDKDNLKLLLEKGQLCKNKMDFDCTKATAARAFVLDSTNLEVRQLYGWSLINKPNPPLEDIEDAKRHYKYVLADKPNDPNLMVEVANTYSLTGDFETSFKYINDALRIDDQIRDAYVLKGSNYRIVENYDLALSSYQTAVQIDPDYFTGHMQIGYLLTELERHELALEYYTNALNLDDQAIEAHYGVAKSLQDLERYSEAQAAYRELISTDPSIYIAYHNQGVIKQYFENELDSAIYYYNKTLDVEPQSVRTLHNLGETYYALDRYSDAARAYAEVLRLNPDYEPTLIAKEKLRK